MAALPLPKKKKAERILLSLYEQIVKVMDYSCKNDEITHYFMKLCPQRWWPLAENRNIHQEGAEDLFRKD